MTKKKTDEYCVLILYVFLMENFINKNIKNLIADLKMNVF